MVNGVGGLVLDIRSPHARGKLLEIALVNDEARVAQNLGHALAGEIEDGLHALLHFEIHVLHAVGVEVAVPQHLPGRGITVETAQDDVPRFAGFLVFAGGFDAETIEGKWRSDEVKMKLIPGCACRALTTPAWAFSLFHSVGTRATTSTTSGACLTAA